MILQHFLHSVFTTPIYEISNLFLTEHIIETYEEYGLVQRQPAILDELHLQG
jgi:hypothetical protein